VPSNCRTNKASSGSGLPIIASSVPHQDHLRSRSFVGYCPSFHQETRIASCYRLIRPFASVRARSSLSPNRRQQRHFYHSHQPPCNKQQPRTVLNIECATSEFYVSNSPYSRSIFRIHTMGFRSLISFGVIILPIGATLGVLLGLDAYRRSTGQQPLFQDNSVSHEVYCQKAYGITPSTTGQQYTCKSPLSPKIHCNSQRQIVAPYVAAALGDKFDRVPDP